jgi:hypothetical protein
VDGRSGQKQVIKVRAAEAKQEGFMLVSNMVPSNEVAHSEWIGRHSHSLPKQVFTRGELENGHGMVYFDWDGM